MAKTSISSLFLLLLCIQISFLPFTTASEDPHNSDPFYHPEPLVSHSADLEIIPGITKHLLIRLQGQEEEVTFSFQPDEADPSVFESLVLVNNKVEVSHTSNFPTQESLTVTFDYDAEQCTISGDKGFVITGPIHEKEYKVQVIHDKGAGYQEEIVAPENTAPVEETNRTFVFSAAAGTCGLIVIALKIGISLKKRRKSVILGDLPAICQTDEELSKKDDCEGEDNYKGYVESLTEIPLKPQVNPEPVPVKAPPKMCSKTQLSTASTLGVIAPPPLFKKGKAATHVKFTDEDIQESNETERKACVQQKACTIAKIKPEIKKQPFKEDKDNNDTVELSLDLEDFEGDKDPRRAPTMKEIKALVKKMEAEGTIGYECDPSAESDDEDQYEAPQLPDYFCCMLCFKGKRCTIVKPCRHIFSCTDCVEDLLKTYKICVLCANEINGYEPL